MTDNEAWKLYQQELVGFPQSDRRSDSATYAVGVTNIARNDAAHKVTAVTDVDKSNDVAD